MPFQAKDVIKRMVAETIQPQLKALGYRKSAFTWRKSVGDLIRIVNVQLSQGNQPHDAKFTINLGVYHPGWFEARNGCLPQENIFEYHCEPRIRIGQLMNRKMDYWWRVVRNEDHDKVREHLNNTFTQYAVPWLEQFEELSDMLRFFLHRRQFFNAAITAYVLENDNVPELITQAIAHAPHDLSARMVEIWARDHAIFTGQE